MEQTVDTKENPSENALQVVPRGADRSVIKHLDEVPKGRVLSGRNGQYELPELRRRDFLLYQVEQTQTLILYVSTDLAGHPEYYDVTHRLQKQDLTFRSVQAARDIIKILYEKNAHQTDQQKVSSDPEKLAQDIIETAYRQGCSDIHIETRDAHAEVMLRINGKRIPIRTIATESALSLTRILFNVEADSASKDVSWDMNVVSDAAVDWKTDEGKRVQLRLSSSPISPAGNFHVVIRLLKIDPTIRDVNTIGYEPMQMDMINIMTSGSSGLVLLCGPTNSGKTTTLQSVIGRISHKRGKEIKIITVEDPVELIIPGACQISVGKSRVQNQDSMTGSVFTSYLRGTLRQDPDIVMVGEMRNSESVDITRDLVLAGRKVFTTLHTFNALGAFIRLREMGLPWDILTTPGFVSGVVYQRLLPTLCPHCSKRIFDHEGLISDELRTRLSSIVDIQSEKNQIRIRGEGCDHCNSGISGRTVVAETLLPDRHLLKLLSTNDMIGAEEYWRTKMPSPFTHTYGPRKPGTVLQHALAKMEHGLVSPEDIESDIGIVNFDSVSMSSELTQAEMDSLTGRNN